MTERKRMNHKMAALLQGANGHHLIEIPREVAKLISDELVETARGCIVFRSDAEHDFIEGAYHTKTGFEAFHNHFHIDPAHPQDDNPLWIGLNVLERWKAMLRDIPIAGPFSMSLSFNLEDHICTVRLTRFREDEGLLAEDLEGYAEDAVMEVVLRP